MGAPDSVQFYVDSSFIDRPLHWPNSIKLIFARDDIAVKLSSARASPTKARANNDAPRVKRVFSEFCRVFYFVLTRYYRVFFPGIHLHQSTLHSVEGHLPGTESQSAPLSLTPPPPPTPTRLFPRQVDRSGLDFPTMMERLLSFT